MERFHYLSVAIAQTVLCEGKVVVSTQDAHVLGSLVPGADESEYPLRPCNHEEFDTRVLSHAAYAVSHGYTRILTIANDTNIIVLGISLFSYIGADKLWVSLGAGNKLRNISTDDICSTMYSVKAKALPAFDALPGSDNTSIFSSTGKKSAYAKWSTRPELTTTLCHLMDKPETPSSDDIAVIESFVISLYSVSCTLTDVNQARQQIFAQSSHTFEYMYLPPTKAALVEHVKITTHQAGYVCGQSIIAKQVLPSPRLWGWVKSEIGWVQSWTALPRADNVMNVLNSCGCTTSCTGRCSFYKKGTVCTARCRCPLLGDPILFLLRRLQTNTIAVI